MKCAPGRKRNGIFAGGLVPNKKRVFEMTKHSTEHQLAVAQRPKGAANRIAPPSLIALVARDPFVWFLVVLMICLLTGFLGLLSDWQRLDH